MAEVAVAVNEFEKLAMAVNVVCCKLDDSDSANTSTSISSVSDNNSSQDLIPVVPDSTTHIDLSPPSTCENIGEESTPSSDTNEDEDEDTTTTNNTNTTTNGSSNTNFDVMTECPALVDTYCDPNKMFVGGLSWHTTTESIRVYFSMFGEVAEVMVMKDPATRRSRGFGFVTFCDADSVDRVINHSVHQLDGKIIEPKRAVPRKSSVYHAAKQHLRTNKIFIGGVSSTTSLDDVKGYFSQFSLVADAMLAYDRMTSRHRGFGFITFDNEDIVDKICEIHFHEINGKMVESKRAMPRESRLAGTYMSRTGRPHADYATLYRHYYNLLTMGGANAGASPPPVYYPSPSPVDPGSLDRQQYLRFYQQSTAAAAAAVYPTNHVLGSTATTSFCQTGTGFGHPHHERSQPSMDHHHQQHQQPKLDGHGTLVHDMLIQSDAGEPARPPILDLNSSSFPALTEPT